jgi:hypothetical protein
MEVACLSVSVDFNLITMEVAHISASIDLLTIFAHLAECISVRNLDEE